MAYRTGTSSGRVSALSYNGSVGFIGTGGTVTNQTVLASQVRPPSDPDSATVFVIVLFLSGIILVISSIVLYEIFGIIGFPAGFCLTAGLVFCLYKFTESTREKNKLNYEQHFAKWSRSWVCLRCGANWMI